MTELRFDQDKEWSEAADKEINGLVEDKVFEIVDRNSIEQDCQIIRLLTIFAIKEDGRKKVRTCVMGNLRNDEDIGDSL